MCTNKQDEKEGATSYGTEQKHSWVGLEYQRWLKENGAPKPRVWLLPSICCLCKGASPASTTVLVTVITQQHWTTARKWSVWTMDRPLVRANARLYSQGEEPLSAFNRDDTQWRSKQCVLHLVAPTNHLEISLKFCNSGLEWAPSSKTLPGGDNATGMWTTVLTKIWEILSGRTFQERLLYKGMKKGRGQNALM